MAKDKHPGGSSTYTEKLKTFHAKQSFPKPDLNDISELGNSWTSSEVSAFEDFLALSKKTSKPPQTVLAKWPPDRKNREYFWVNGKPIQRIQLKTKDGNPYEGKGEVEMLGQWLPSNVLFDALSTADEADRLDPKQEISDFYQELLQKPQFFTNLPAEFFEAYLLVQCSGDPIPTFPRLGKNKDKTVMSCMEGRPAFTTGPLRIDNWEALGWNSRDDYVAWLNESMLFAFVHCCPYFSVPRIFDVDKETSTPSKTHFKQVVNNVNQVADKTTKRTNIFTVTGFEYRGYSTDEEDRRKTLPKVTEHSRLTMLHMLNAAEQTDTTDIVWIPYGMGVFIRTQVCEQEIKDATFEGMRQALSEYKGKYVTLHCCAFFKKLTNGIKNPQINFQDRSDLDALTIANDIQDRGDWGEIQSPPPGSNTEQRQLKSMLVNAGDGDWMVLLDPRAVPGQYFRGHHLFRDTSDEYFGIMTAFPVFFIRRIIQRVKHWAHGIVSSYNLNASITARLEITETPSSSIDLSSVKQQHSGDDQVTSPDEKRATRKTNNSTPSKDVAPNNDSVIAKPMTEIRDETADNKPISEPNTSQLEANNGSSEALIAKPMTNTQDDSSKTPIEKPMTNTQDDSSKTPIEKPMTDNTTDHKPISEPKPSQIETPIISEKQNQTADNKLISSDIPPQPKKTITLENQDATTNTNIDNITPECSGYNPKNPPPTQHKFIAPLIAPKKHWTMQLFNPSIWGTIMLGVVGIGLLSQGIAFPIVAGILATLLPILAGIYLVALAVSVGSHIFSEKNTSPPSSALDSGKKLFGLGLGLSFTAMIALVVLLSVGFDSFMITPVEFIGHFVLLGLKNLGLDSALVLDTHLAMIIGTVLLLSIPLIAISMLVMNQIASDKGGSHDVSEQEDMRPDSTFPAVTLNNNSKQPYNTQILSPAQPTNSEKQADNLSTTTPTPNPTPTDSSTG